MTNQQLMICQFIAKPRNVIIQGATGIRKSYITNVLCKCVIEEGYTARYRRMYDLLTEMAQADLEDELTKYLKRIAKIDAFVIDDFLLTAITEHEQKYLMEVFELRSKKRPLIISFQIGTGEWHNKLGGGGIADAILARAASESYHIYMYGDA